MIQVRSNTFETNSSSTHSLVIGMAADMQKWRSGETYLNQFSDDYPQFVTKEQIIEMINHTVEVNPDSYKGREAQGVLDALNRGDSLDSALDDNELLDSYDGFTPWELWGDRFETDDGKFTTPSGEKIEWVAYYGYDG